MKRRCRDEITNEDRAPCCQASNFPYTIPIFERCLVEAIGDLYATPTDFWRPGIAGKVKFLGSLIFFGQFRV